MRKKSLGYSSTSTTSPAGASSPKPSPASGANSPRSMKPAPFGCANLTPKPASSAQQDRGQRRSPTPRSSIGLPRETQQDRVDRASRCHARPRHRGRDPRSPLALFTASRHGGSTSEFPRDRHLPGISLHLLPSSGLCRRGSRFQTARQLAGHRSDRDGSTFHHRSPLY